MQIPIKDQIKKARLEYSRYIVRRFFSNLETYGGIIGGKAVLFCYNEEAPELSYILTEDV